ncbi:MAG: hypothetical protein IID44_06760 [Planctomycetes bacterium]|nr:hypothetical protein [Planctomycetota bacterium]
MRLSVLIVTCLLIAGVVSAQDVKSDVPPKNPGLPAAARVEDGADDGLASEELTAELKKLKTLLAKVDQVLAVYKRRQLNTRDHSPWEVMHSLVAYGCDTEIFRGGPGGKKVNAIGWLCWSGTCNRQQLMYLDGNRPVAAQGPGVQGHDGQFLAMLAQSRVNINYPLKVGGRDFAVRDLVESEKLGCRSGSELTFQLIGLVHYLPSDAEWKNSYGQTWNIERLIREEIAQPIRGATCGGSHRLFGLAYAVRKRQQRGEPIDGEYRRAQIYMNDFHKYAYKLQNDDGSFSTAYFRGRGSDSSRDQRLRTTGHVLEWLSFSVPEEELTDPRMMKAVNYLAGILLAGQNRRWEIGPQGHALHGLMIYRHRAGKRFAADKPAEAKDR